MDHAEWALWRLGADAEAIAPVRLRVTLRDRAAAIVASYGRAAGNPDALPVLSMSGSHHD